MDDKEISPLYLILDQGGHASRAIVFDSQGNTLCKVERPVATFRNGLYIEHDADELVKGLLQAIDEILLRIGDQHQNIVAAGMATQRSNMLCWRRSDNKPLSPVISWQDRRAENKLASIDIKIVRQKTGLFANAHYGATKMAWCLENLPEVASAAENDDLMMGPMASYLASRLTASEALADPANASRTLLWNIHTRQWDDELCDWFAIDKNSLPRCVSSDHGFGELALLDRRVLLQIVTGDLSAAAFANGQPSSDSAYITLGTGAFVQRTSSQLHSHPALLNGVVWISSDQHVLSLEGTVNGAGSAISWLAEQHKVHESELYKNMNDWCVTKKDVPLFYNAISGMGSPIWCVNESAKFSHSSGLAEQVVSVIESIVFLLALNIEEMANILEKPNKIIVNGGLSKIDSLCQKLADISNIPVWRSNETEGTARGLAYLLRGNSDKWPTYYNKFRPSDNEKILQRYHDWFEFAREQSSDNCHYFENKKLKE